MESTTEQTQTDCPHLDEIANCLRNPELSEALTADIEQVYEKETKTGNLSKYHNILGRYIEKKLLFVVETITADSSEYEDHIATLTIEVEENRGKWIEEVKELNKKREKKYRKPQAENLQKLNEIVKENVLRIGKVNENLRLRIANLVGARMKEQALMYEISMGIQDLRYDISTTITENASKIEQELAYLRPSATLKNYEKFQKELQADREVIHAEYEEEILRFRQINEEMMKYKMNDGSSIISTEELQRELAEIRSQLIELEQRLADVEGRNMFLERTIEDLREQTNEEMEMFEIVLTEKDNACSTLIRKRNQLSEDLRMFCAEGLKFQDGLERFCAMLHRKDETVFPFDEDTPIAATSETTVLEGSI